MVSVGGLLLSPVTIVSELAQVASRALALLDLAEPIARRIGELTDNAERIAGDVDGLAGTAARVTASAEATTAKAAAAVDSLQPLLETLAELDGALVTKLLDDLKDLPTVLEQLASQVDHLDRTVSDVGNLLQSIPGAARLVKRNDRLTAR